MKIGILYICTGKYTVFWKDFYSSCEKYFIPEAEKHYFVFTDSEIIDFENTNKNIHRTYQENLGWPNNTLMRFDIFLKAKEHLLKMDYIFFCNANLLFLEQISAAEFLPTGNENLVACIHPGFYNKIPSEFTYDRNENSTAHIPFNSGTHYYAGGINGGKCKQFIDAMTEMNKNISIDSQNGVVALWHDESHWNKYILKEKPNLKELSTAYLYPEGSELPFSPKILVRGKERLGNVEKLRGTKNNHSAKIKIKKIIRRGLNNILNKLFSFYDNIVYSQIATRYYKKRNPIKQTTRKISVAITSFNREKIIHKSLANILNDDRVDEIVILDDGSGEESFTRTKKALSSFHNKKIKLFRRQKNFGILATKIEVASLCTNDWLILLDSDNSILPSYLDSLFNISAWDEYTIYCPSFAYPFLDFRIFSNQIFDFQKIKQGLITKTEKLSLFLNDGNFFLHRKKFCDIMNIYKSFNVYASDIIFINYIWLSNQGKLSVLPDCAYIHRIHKKSTWKELANPSVFLFETIKNKILMAERCKFDKLKQDISLSNDTTKTPCQKFL
ncbi:MAG: family 6 glucosyltransferase [Candidatus Paceibacterota bacterium]|jgi:glycosyltransferase involved in cell wall biosynthesis